jgi:hypothetical protein
MEKYSENQKRQHVFSVAFIVTSLTSKMIEPIYEATGVVDHKEPLGEGSNPIPHPTTGLGKS